METSLASKPDSIPVMRPVVGKKPGLDPVWIAWETQRRSMTLSRRIGAALHIFDDEKRGLLRFPLSIIKTLSLLLRSRGRVVIVQNPSMLLAALACLLHKSLGYTLVVDRHSNFDFWGESEGLEAAMRNLLSAYTLRNADVTVVTNPELKTRIEGMGARGFVLPDPFPELNESTHAQPGTPMEILFVASWAPDEPIAEVMEMCRGLQNAVRVRITGRVKPRFERLLSDRPANFIPTGFIPDEEYFHLMGKSDCVLAVTKRPETLVCGAYEAIAMGKPVILGDSQTLREYFSQGAVYTDCRIDDLAAKVMHLRAHYSDFVSQIKKLREMRAREWDGRLQELQASLGLA